MQNYKKKAKKKKPLMLLITAIVAVAIVIFAVFILFMGTSIEGRWELIEIRVTSEQIEMLPVAQRAMLAQYFEERNEQENLELQFFGDGTGLMTLNASGNAETHTFNWSSEDGRLTQRIGLISSEMEYEVSFFRLVITDHSEDGGIVREFRRVR